jgi:transcriptional regulator with XRE-family HTH domain
MQRFGEKLRTLRKRRGMTLVELTRALGYANNGYLSLIENGKITPRVEFVVKVATLFQVPTDQLVRDELELDAPGAATEGTISDNEPGS